MRRLIIAVIAPLVAVAGWTGSAAANHNRCHNEETPPDVWLGIVGVDVGDPWFNACVGDQDYGLVILINPGAETGATVEIRQCDQSSGGTCSTIVGPTGATSGGLEPGPACVSATAHAAGSSFGPFNVGVCQE